MLPTIISGCTFVDALRFISAKFKFVKPYNVISGILGPIGCGLITLLEVDSNFSQQVGLLIILGVLAGLQMQPSFYQLKLRHQRLHQE